MLATLEAKGVRLFADGESLSVGTGKKLTDIQRKYLKANKQQIMAELQQRQPTELSPEDQSTVLTWLAQIKETSPANIQHTLDICATNPDTLGYVLNQAKRTFNFQ